MAMKPEILAALELQGRILKDMAGTCGSIARALAGQPNFSKNEGADTLSKRQGDTHGAQGNQTGSGQTV